ncbi:MAG TPA: hypothetical protein VFO57_09225 [Burkholderiales bacterium]|nr:hypothetical protein [Burkholderiales bacterium]
MRYVIIVLWSLIWSVTSATAQVSIGIGLPNVSIGINLPLYPELVPVPGYPVYYAPRVSSNYFFYDGMYWVYHDDNWYASSWYNGPWGLVAPQYVPYFVLRIPVRYYRQPPPYFRGWRADAPPRWGDHWGRDWERRRAGWDRWDRRSVPAPAPLPVYQRQYSGDRYPRAEQQRELHGQHYRYQPRSAAVRQHYQERAVQRAPESSQRGQPGEPQPRGSRPQANDRSASPPPSQREPQGKGASQEQSRGQGRDRDPEPQGKGASQDQIRGQGQDKGREPQGKGASQEKGRGQGQDKAREPQGKGESQEQRRGQGQDRDRDREKG